MISDRQLDGADGRVGQRNGIAGDRLAVDDQPFLFTAADGDVITRTAEQTGETVAVHRVRQAGIDDQSVVIRANAEDALTDGDERPRGCAGEPCVLGFAVRFRPSGAPLPDSMFDYGLPPAQCRPLSRNTLRQ